MLSETAPRARQKAETRARLLDHARRLFQQVGYQDTTLAAVAREAGVAVGTVCLHFPDKQALVLAAFHADIALVVGGAWQGLPAGDLHTQLRHLAGALYAWYAGNPAAQGLVQASTFPQGPGAAEVMAQAAQFVDAVEGLVQAAVARGELSADTPTAVIARGFFADYLLVLLMGLQGQLGAVEGWGPHLDALTAARLHGWRGDPPKQEV